MGQTQIFVLKDDLLPLFADVECKGALRYSLSGRFLEPRIKTYSSGAEIPNLSVATHESASSCARYLGYEPSVSLIFDTVTETDRDNKPIGKSYHLDQLHNPATIVFHPRGPWKNEILLYGSLSSVLWVNESAKKILKRFQSRVWNTF